MQNSSTPSFNYESLKLFYIGKQKQQDGTQVPLVYKNNHLRTHAAILGMTGSGKTGLGISLLEEATIDNIPSIIIDPKGDMGNLLLTFPDLKSEDFKPWIEEQDAINNGVTIDELAEQTAERWKKGIDNDFQNQERIAKLKKSADFTIYTPGSSAGVQISILSTFKAPSIEVIEDTELLTSLINSNTSSILSLIDIKNDLNSKEGILISSIFMNYYTQGKDLSLESLISLIVTPPFKKVGVFDLETFFEQDERLKLALKLNTIIANPSFKKWIEGETLDISKLLYDENGKAKVSIFTISHLDETQRMFFVSLLLNEMLAWMRRQEGTSSLKALLYMDEIYGYFPPSANPPSKQAMMTLLKQARSFGLGIILSTQNPVDLDYKGLSNIGTWFIGRLQTKQDIEKVIDGLSSASDQAINKAELREMIANLEKRHFILKNINEDNITLFSTRWVLSYLKGPLSKENIKKLMTDKIATLTNNFNIAKNTQNVTASSLHQSQTKLNTPSVKPILAPNLVECFEYYSQSEMYYLQPYLQLSCNVHFVNASKNIDDEQHFNYKFYLDENTQDINFDELEYIDEKTSVENKARPNSQYYHCSTLIQNEQEIKAIAKAFSNYIYRNQKLTLFTNKEFKLTSKQNESLADFKIRLQDRLNEMVDLEVEKLQEKFEKQLLSLENKLEKQYEKLEKEEQQAQSATTDTLLSIGTSIIGAFFGRSIASKSNINKVATSARRASKAMKERNDIKYVQEEIARIEQEIENLKKEVESSVEKVNEQYKISNYEIEEVFIKPRRNDIYDVNVKLRWCEE